MTHRDNVDLESAHFSNKCHVIFQSRVHLHENPRYDMVATLSVVSMLIQMRLYRIRTRDLWADGDK